MLFFLIFIYLSIVIFTNSAVPDRAQSAVDEIIEYMDGYYLSREDWDTIVELGVDEKRDDSVLKKISAATKTAFTRKQVLSTVRLTCC